jgi:hypothetical protein
MKKMMEMFSLATLSKNEMKGISGGNDCRVCSKSPTGGACGSYNLTESEAKQIAKDGNASKDGYTYTVDCHVA